MRERRRMRTTPVQMQRDLDSSDYLVVGKNSLPLSSLHHFDFLSLFEIVWTDIVSVAQYLGAGNQLLLPRQFSSITESGATLRNTSLYDCGVFKDNFIKSVEKNHLYMEQSLQTSYTAAFYFLFQNAVRRQQPNTTAERGSTPSLAFSGNLQPMDVQVSIPTTNAIVSLIGCFLLFVVSIGIVFHAKNGEHALQKRANAEIVTEAMMNTSKYPPLLLKMELEQNDMHENLLYPLHDLRIQSVLLHHSEGNKQAFHLASGMK